MSNLSHIDEDWIIDWDGSEKFSVYHNGEEVNVSTLDGRDGKPPTDADAVEEMVKTLCECLAGER